jgi:hypothetical protein
VEIHPPPLGVLEWDAGRFQVAPKITLHMGTPRKNALIGFSHDRGSTRTQLVRKLGMDDHPLVPLAFSLVGPELKEGGPGIKHNVPPQQSF